MTKKNKSNLPDHIAPALGKEVEYEGTKYIICELKGVKFLEGHWAIRMVKK